MKELGPMSKPLKKCFLVRNNSIYVKWDFLTILYEICIQMFCWSTVFTTCFVCRQDLLRTQKSNLTLEFQVAIWFLHVVFLYFSSSKNHIRCHISFYNKWSLFCRLTGIETVTHSLEDLNHFIIQLESKWNIGKLTEVNWGENIFWLMIPPKWQYILKKECHLAPSEFSWKSPSN